MQILHWNIQHGGGPKRTPQIALAILDLRPDLVVLTEFRRTTGGQLAGVLHDHGLNHQLCTDPPPQTNGILVAARSPLVRASSPRDPDLAQRSLDAHLPEFDAWLTAVHLPDAARSDHHATARKANHWQALLRLARARAAGRHVLVGDFNTGRHRLDEAGSTFTCTPLLGKLATLGYADAYRALDPAGADRSWYSHTGQGFRLDHAYVSPALRPALRAAEYLQTPRKQGLSDHAPMRLALDPTALAAPATPRSA